jgi:hypothetical protein
MPADFFDAELTHRLEEAQGSLSALEVSVEALKQEVREQARGALLRDLAKKLNTMDAGPHLGDDATSRGYSLGVAHVRKWMVSQSAIGDLNAGNETT